MYLCNVYVFNNGSECDFVTIDYKDITHEFEVKISRSDYLADFKKDKHQFLQALHDKQKLVTVRGQEVNATCDITWMLQHYENWKMWRKEIDESRGIGYRPPQQHRELNWSCEVMVMEVKPQNFPNKFSFIVPEGLVSKEEVPAYAGLSYLMPNGSIKAVKRAKKLHNMPFDNWRDVAVKMYWKCRNNNIL